MHFIRKLVFFCIYWHPFKVPPNTLKPTIIRAFADDCDITTIMRCFEIEWTDEFYAINVQRLKDLLPIPFDVMRLVVEFKDKLFIHQSDMVECHSIIVRVQEHTASQCIKGNILFNQLPIAWDSLVDLGQEREVDHHASFDSPSDSPS